MAQDFVSLISQIIQDGQNVRDGLKKKSDTRENRFLDGFDSMLQKIDNLNSPSFTTFKQNLENSYQNHSEDCTFMCEVEKWMLKVFISFINKEESFAKSADENCSLCCSRGQAETDEEKTKQRMLNHMKTPYFVNRATSKYFLRDKTLLGKIFSEASFGQHLDMPSDNFESHLSAIITTNNNRRNACPLEEKCNYPYCPSMWFEREDPFWHKLARYVKRSGINHEDTIRNTLSSEVYLTSLLRELYERTTNTSYQEHIDMYIDIYTLRKGVLDSHDRRTIVHDIWDMCRDRFIGFRELELQRIQNEEQEKAALRKNIAKLIYKLIMVICALVFLWLSFGGHFSL